MPCVKALSNPPVAVPPAIKPFDFGSLVAGMRTTATCTVQTGDSPMTLRWLRDGRPLTPAVDLQISQHDSFSSSLILTHVRPSHAGNYTCEAENPARQVRYTAQLLVRGNVALPRDPPPPPLARERGRGPLSHHRALQPHSTAFFKKSHRFTAPIISPFSPSSDVTIFSFQRSHP